MEKTQSQAMTSNVQHLLRQITDLTKQKIKNFTIDHFFQNLKKQRHEDFSQAVYSTIQPFIDRYHIAKKSLVDFSYYVKQTWDP